MYVTANTRWFDKYDTSNTYSGNNYNDVDIYANALSATEKRNFAWNALWKNIDNRYPYWKKHVLCMVFCNKIVRRMLMGAYSRKYGKPRRKRKKKMF